MLHTINSAVCRLRSHGYVWVNVLAATAIATAASERLGAEVHKGYPQGERVKLVVRYAASDIERKSADSKNDAMALGTMFGYELTEYPHYIRIAKGVNTRSLRNWKEAYDYLMKHA